MTFWSNLTIDQKVIVNFEEANHPGDMVQVGRVMTTVDRHEEEGYGGGD